MYLLLHCCHCGDIHRAVHALSVTREGEESNLRSDDKLLPTAPHHSNPRAVFWMVNHNPYQYIYIYINHRIYRSTTGIPSAIVMIYLRQLDMKVTMMISLIVMRSNTKSQATSKERNIEHRTLGLSMCIRLCLCSSSVCFPTFFSSKRGFQFPVPWASLKYIICPNSNRIVLETFIIPVDPLYHSNKKKTCNTSVKVSKTFVTFPNLGSKPAICSTEILRKDMDFFRYFHA